MTAHYAYRHRVTFDETNLVGNVYFAHYLRWQGHCREQFLADHAPGVLAALSGGLVLVTVDCAAEFYAEAFAGDQLEVRMTLDRLAGNRVTMFFEYVRVAAAEPETLARGGQSYVRVEAAEPETLARGRQSVACMRREAGGLVPAPLPDELRAALDRYRAPT